MSTLLYGMGRVTHIKYNNKRNSAKYVGSSLLRSNEKQLKKGTLKDLKCSLDYLAENIALDEIRLERLQSMTKRQRTSKEIRDKIYLVNSQTEEDIKNSLYVSNAHFNGATDKIAEIEKRLALKKYAAANYEEVDGNRVNTDTGEIKNNVLSSRSKRKIRDKVMAWAMSAKGRNVRPLTFVTLTFVNDVTDTHAVKILNTFLTNLRKKYQQKAVYLWVAERQKNGRIHFHLITSLFMRVDYWNPYWCELQRKEGIINDTGNAGKNPFDVKKIKDVRGVSQYMTKYITKNDGEFACSCWNCSKTISELYTGFYDGVKRFVDMQRLSEFKEFALEYATVFFAENFAKLNFLYAPLNQRNMQVLMQT